ncbi:MAG: hypothetical protein J6T60_09115 [Bacteroidales bacterium]|nr:hypothetical protein [Bacteroidales bacterium]
MRKILILLTALSMCSAINVNAQDDAQATSQFKRFEHNFYAGAGLFIDMYDNYGQTNYTIIDRGLSLKAGYGLNYYFSEMFSLMGSIGVRREAIHPFGGWDGGSADQFGFIDFPITFQVHLNDPDNPKKKWMLGLGIAFSGCTDNDTYYFGDSDSKDPLEGKTIIKDFYVSLMPCLGYEIKHVRFNIETNIGLNDVNRKYKGLYTGKKNLYNLCGVIYFKF